MPILSYINCQNLTIVLNFLYLKKIDFVKLILFVIFFSLFFYLNLSNQSTNYGTRGGQFEDQADSYSHYLIRNTIINNIIGRENQNKSLIITKNYVKEDFNYYPDETKIYTHSRSYQNKIYQKIILNSPFFKINSDQNYKNNFYFFLKKIKIIPNNSPNINIEYHIQFFRFINCFILSIIIISFSISIIGRNYLAMLMTLLISLITGISIFSSNLYVPIWTLILPLTFYKFLHFNKSFIFYFFLCLFGSFVNFSSTYLFAPTYGFISLLPIVIYYICKKEFHFKLCFAAFLGVILGFILALLFHTQEISNELSISFTEAFNSITESSGDRFLSIKDVPYPGSLSFFKAILSRQLWIGFNIPFIISIPKSIFLFLFIYLLIKELKSEYKILFFWGLITYVVYYLLFYNHIMHHDFFDTLLSAISIQITLIIFIFMKLIEKLNSNKK